MQVSYTQTTWSKRNGSLRSYSVAWYSNFL